jgi:hypothetical protein
VPWRPRPRAAFLILLSAGALTAAAAGLRPPNTRPENIDDTLTRDEAGCAPVSANVWHPLSGLDYTGRLQITLPARFGGAIALYVGDSIPLDIEASNERGDPVAINLERLIAGPGVLLPPDFWIHYGSPLDAPRHVSRLLIDASGDRERRIVVALGRRAPRVIARLVGYPPTVRVPVCADPVRAGESYFATGWYGQESEPGIGPVRWMRGQGAALVFSPDGREARVRLRIAPAVAAVGDDVTQLSVRVNDFYELAPITLRARFHDYELVVPDAAWVSGTNELLFTVSRTHTIGSRVRGLALASLHAQ